MQYKNGSLTLKELLTQRIDLLEKLEDERFHNINVAITLQSKETERRLGLLNGEADRLKRMQATYLPREVYESNHQLLENKIDTINKFIYIGMGGLMVLEILLRFLKF